VAVADEGPAGDEDAGEPGEPPEDDVDVDTRDIG